MTRRVAIPVALAVVILGAAGLVGWRSLELAPADGDVPTIEAKRGPFVRRVWADGNLEAAAATTLGPPHTVDEPGILQAFASMPLQNAPHGPNPAHAARPPCAPPLTAVHTPALPATSHASHWPVQAASQQTPSTQ